MFSPIFVTTLLRVFKPKINSHMKPVKLFYQERCPFCKKALRYIEELKAEYPEFQPIEIEMIEETQHPDIADQYDYYYVPTFYVDGVKVHEAGIFKNEMEALLRKVIE
ncbi:MAG: thioredoxin family protein [Phocaeicola vulgatus]